MEKKFFQIVGTVWHEDADGYCFSVIQDFSDADPDAEPLVSGREDTFDGACQALFRELKSLNLES